VLAEHSQLGAGLSIAMRDLERAAWDTLREIEDERAYSRFLNLEAQHED